MNKDKIRHQNTIGIIAVFVGILLVIWFTSEELRTELSRSASRNVRNSDVSRPPPPRDESQRASLNWPSGAESTPTSNQQQAFVLSQDQALQLVQSWLDSKARIFAPPFDEDLLRRHIVTTSETFRTSRLDGGSMGWLKENGFYYAYEFSEVSDVLEFGHYITGVQIVERAYIVVNVYESLTQYDSGGRVVPENSGQSRQSFRYELAQENGQWKIFSSSRVQ